MGEVENISPGLTRTFLVELAEPRRLRDRLQAGHGRRRHPRRVHRHRRSAAPKADDRAPRGGHRRVPALRRAARPTRFLEQTTSSSTSSRPARSTRPRRCTRPPARTGSASSRSPSPSATSTRRSTAAPRSSRRAWSSPASTASSRTSGRTASRPTPAKIADQLLADVTELVDQGQGRRAQPAPARQRLQGAPRRDGDRQDHRRGGALQPHRPLGLRGELRGLQGRDPGAAPVPRGGRPRPRRRASTSAARPSATSRDAPRRRRLRPLHRADARRRQGAHRGARRLRPAGLHGRRRGRPG